jgi:transcriptional regulator with XRE-family HTH domain
VSPRPATKTPTEFGQQLNAVLARANTSSSFLALQLGYTPGYISHLIYGTKEPSEELIGYIAGALELNAVDKAALLEAYKPQVRVTVHVERDQKRARVQGTLPAKHAERLREFLASLDS